MTKTITSPRQKMINMMYLVLTALLAMNVSKEILKAFHTMDEGFAKNKSGLESKIQSSMDNFDFMMKNESKKTKPYFAIANEINIVANDFVKFIDIQKANALKSSGGLKKEIEKGHKSLMPKNGEDIEKHYTYFIKEKNGYEIQQKINETRIKLLSLLQDNKAGVSLSNKNIANTLAQSTSLIAEDGKTAEEEWVNTYLGEKQPLGSIIPFLTKLQTDARALQSDALTELLSSIDADRLIAPNKLAVAVVSKTTFVRTGEPFKAEIYLAAYDSRSQPNVIVNGTPLKVENGKAIYQASSQQVGEHTFNGKLIVKTQNGETKTIPFKQTWTSFNPSASIGLDKMNLMYTGIKNPITVSVSGYSSKDIVATSSTARIVKSTNGKYNVFVKKGTQKVIVNISVKGKPMGSQTYRVRNIPAPNGQLGGIAPTTENITKSELLYGLRTGLIVGLGRDFPYQGLKFKFLSCTVKAFSQRNGLLPISCRGNLKNAISPCKKLLKGDFIKITNIKAKAPNGSIKTVKSLLLTIK